MLNDDILWVEKYRPKNIRETILPENLKKTFQTFVDSGKVPNLLFAGGPGVGKTTVARALCEELNIDYIIINGSMNGNIDTLRNEIKEFASSVSFTGSRKVVILDEADYLNPNSTQPALRNFMEEYSKNCGFILTCNMPNRIIPPLHSRCSVVTFNIDKKDAPGLAMQFLSRTKDILDKEGIEYDVKAVAQLIQTYFPDWRRVLNELQRYSATGRIDVGILTNFSDDNVKKLIGLIKDKKWTEMRKWVAENIDLEPTAIMRKLYDIAYDVVKPEDIPTLVLILNKYDYQNAFVADKEVNLVACLTEVFGSVEFK